MVARKKSKGTELAVFKGREAKLNRAIFQSLALKGPQSIYDLHKTVRNYSGLRHTHYGNVNKRVWALKEQNYVKTAGIQKTKAGFKAAIYELTIKAYLSTVLSSTNLENLLNQIDEGTATEFLAIVAGRETWFKRE
jgi:hypothetical protein